MTTLEVIKLFPNVIEVNDRHSLNIEAIVFTSAVLKFDKSISSILEHP